MALASGVTIEIDGQEGSVSARARWSTRGRARFPGGLKNNRDFAACAVEMARELAPEIEKPALRSPDLGRPVDLGGRGRKLPRSRGTCRAHI